MLFKLACLIKKKKVRMRKEGSSIIESGFVLYAFPFNYCHLACTNFC